MTCPCGVGMDEAAVEALILNHLTDIDSHDHDIDLDGDDVYTITQNYADARPATEFVVPGLAAANTIASEWRTRFTSANEALAPQVVTAGAGFAVLGTTSVYNPPAAWGTYRLFSFFSARVDIPAGVSAYMRILSTVDGGSSNFFGKIVTNPFGVTYTVNVPGYDMSQDLSGSVDRDTELSIIALSSGTTLDVTYKESSYISARIS